MWEMVFDLRFQVIEDYCKFVMQVKILNNNFYRKKESDFKNYLYKTEYWNYGSSCYNFVFCIDSSALFLPK